LGRFNRLGSSRLLSATVSARIVPRIVIVALSCLAVGLFVVAPADATPWLAAAPLEISFPGEDVEEPRVAIDAQGNAVVVWMQIERNEEPNGNPNCCYDFDVQSTVGPALGGVWQPPLYISPPGESIFPAVAVDPQGDALAVWRSNLPTSGVIDAAFRPAANGIWQVPVAISASGEEGALARVAFDSQGDAFAVWQREENREDEADGRVMASMRPAASGSWQAPVRISPANQEAGGASLAVDPRGDAIALWTAGRVLQAAARPAQSGVWQAPVDLSEANPPANLAPGDAALRLNPQGDAVVVWQRTNSERQLESSSTLQASFGSASSGVWQAPLELPAGPERPQPPEHSHPMGVRPNFRPQGDLEPSVAIDAQGDAIAAWTRVNGSARTIQAAAHPVAGGSWQTPIDLSAVDEETVGYPQLATDSQGNAVAIWESAGGIRGSVRPQASSSWQGPVNLSAENERTSNPQLAANPSGDSILVWESLGISALGFNIAAGLPAQPVNRPVITQARFASKRFRVAKRHMRLLAARSAPETPLGTSISFTLSARAKLTITVTQSKPGLRRASSCGAPSTELRREHARRCTRILTLGSDEPIAETPGEDSVQFEGRIGGHDTPLRPGAYHAILAANNTSGRSQPVTLPFTIVRQSPRRARRQD
jgi:hypothetical protein